MNEIPPSNNKYLGNNHSHFIYGADKQKWFKNMCFAMDKNNRPKEPIEKARVTITYYFKDKRRRDPDNYSGKFILDPLVKLKIIKDDSFGVIELVLRAYTDKENPRTEIEIKRID